MRKDAWDATAGRALTFPAPHNRSREGIRCAY